MTRWLGVLAGALLGWLLLAGAAWAYGNCWTQTYVQGLKQVTCTTCCYAGICRTTCWTEGD